MSESIAPDKMTRRTFLKATAATTAVAAVGDKLFGGPVSALVKRNAPAAQVAEDVWIPTACKHCGTGSGMGCGLLIHRVNGVVVGVRPNPQCRRTGGRACAKAHAIIHKLYNPYRVKAPMKRTNPEKARFNSDTGRWEGVDPGWVEISWDEALDTVASKLRPIRETNPHAFLHLRGHGSSSSAFGRDFARSFGTHSNTVSGGGGMICAASRHQIAYIYNGTSGMGSSDMYNRYEIGWGSGGRANKADPQLVPELWARHESGQKTVVIDVRCSEEASKATEWITVRPGSDGALGRALCHVLLNELGIYDEEFMKLRSNAPYLIGPDGLYVRSKTEFYTSRSRNGEDFGKPLIWDPVDNKAKTWDDESIQDFALEGTFEVDGVPCQPAFQLIVDHYQPFTPEWAEQICEVPAETIRRIAQEYGEAASIGSTITIDGHVFPYRPAAVECGRGSHSVTHGFIETEWYAHLNAIVGNQNVPGGLQGGDKRSVEPEGDGVVGPKGKMRYQFEWPMYYDAESDIYPTNYKAYWETWRRVLDPERYQMPYELEAVCINGSNPTQTMASLDEVVQGIAKVPFSFAIAYHFDQQVELCDVLLADAGWPEELILVGDNLRQPLLEKALYNTRFPEDVYMALAERIGFLPEFLERIGPAEGDYALDFNEKYTWDEIVDRQLKTDYGGEYGLDWFKRNGIAPAGDPTPESERYVYFFAPNVRYPVYFEYLLWAKNQLKKDLQGVGYTHPKADWEREFTALPEWLPDPILEAPAEYDLVAINWKSNLHAMGFTQDNAYLMEVAARDPYISFIWLNRATGEAKGLKDGDLVWVESHSNGKRQKGEVKLSEIIHPKTVGFSMTANQWSTHMNPNSQLGMIFNQLLSSDYGYVCPVSGQIETKAAVKIYKA